MLELKSICQSYVVSFILDLPLLKAIISIPTLILASLTMPRRKEYSQDLKEAVIRGLKQGLTHSALSRQFSVPRTVVSYWVKKEKIAGNVKNNPRSGRPRKTSENLDRVVKRLSQSNPRLTARHIRDDLEANHAVNVHVSTVKRRLASWGLHGRRPSKKPLISKKNRKARLDFARCHRDWTSDDWSKVAFSDESKFNLFSSDGIKYIRRPANKRHDVKYQVPTVKHGGGNVMVWGCFSRDKVGPLVLVDGKMNSEHYQKILKDHLLPHGKNQMPRGWIFQQDNDPKHTSRSTKTFFRKEKLKVLEWPSQSADLNPIEHLWEELDRGVRSSVSSNKAQFFANLENAWKAIPQSRLAKLVDSMPTRCNAVIAAGGYATKY